jgi:hypothetical protein
VLIAVAVSAAVLAGVTSLVFLSAHLRSPARRATTGAGGTSPAASGTLTLAANAPAVPVPASFLGVSTEYWTIPVWARQMPLLDRVLGMLAVDGPIRLRIGGDSADRVAWAPTKELPEWQFELTPSWLAQVSRIVRQSHVRLILDLNLVTATPAQAARWAKLALAGLPHGSVTALEIGNEPDIYDRAAWRRITAGRGAPHLPARVTAVGYARAFAAYARALARVAPGMPLLAPALAEPQKNFGWVSRLLHSPHPGLMGITAHRYPYSACARPGAPTFPTVPRVLSENATAGMGRTALKVEHISDRAGLPLWLTEINSVTCGGTRGVSDTFATALWAPDALLELVRAGAESASVHVRADAINMAFSLTRHGLIAHPLFYGMVLFARTLGPGARLVPVHLTAPGALHLKAWAVRVDGGIIHVLLIDKGPRPARIRLNLPLAGPATIERLSAPQVTSTMHVALAGRHLGPAGSWVGARRTETVTPGSSGYLVSLPGYSAALVSARLRPGSLGP